MNLIPSRRVFGVALALALPVFAAGCADQPQVISPPPPPAPLPPPPPPPPPPEPPKPVHHNWHHGSNSINGQASMTRPDGWVASCAAGSVSLHRAGDEAAEHGWKARCDIDGHFHFSALPDGNYVLNTTLRVPGENIAEPVHQDLTLHGGETKDIKLGQ